jgi:hypothetical protein
MMVNHHQGKFVWYELMTTDRPAAAEFYRKVVGWQIRDSGLSDRSYDLLFVGETAVGGMMDLPPAPRADGPPPSWMGYIAVNDVDMFAARVKEAGGGIHRAAEDIPSIGRFAVVADPQGSCFALFAGAGDMPAQSAAQWHPGHVGWHELLAADGAAAFDFYAKLFGWTKGDALDMGPMGIYQIFAIGDQAVGGMMTKPAEESRPPRWRYYINVEGIDAAMERVRAGEGQILRGPVEVPGGAWIVQGLDPQGAPFALVGQRG